MGAKYTEAQKAASQKYLGEKTDSIQIRTPKGTKERWREAATAAGTVAAVLFCKCMEKCKG